MKFLPYLIWPVMMTASILGAQDNISPPVDQILYLQQADVALREGRLTQAGEMIAWLESSGDEVFRDDIALLKAEHAIAGRDVATAAIALSAVRNSERNLCRFLTAKGWVAANAGAYDDAIVVLADAGRACPDDPGIWNLLGLALLHKGESEAAGEALEQALILAPNDVGILNNHSLVLLQKGEIELAVRQLTLAAGLSPDNRMVVANRDFASGMLGLKPGRSLHESDAAWSARLVSFAQGAKAATRNIEAEALFSRAMLTMDHFDQTVWSEIRSNENRP
jgi:Flp pilus assembly protein TadD